MHKPKKIILGAAIAACFASNPYWLATLHAAELNTKLPKTDEEIVLGQKITVNLPAQPLAASLKALSAKIGLNITYNDKLIQNKQAPALSGSMRSKEALQKLLVNTGLEAKLNDQTLYIQRIPVRVEDKSVEIEKVEVRAKKFYEIGPLPGLALTKEEIPGNVQSITAQEIRESHSLSLTDLMNRKLQSVTVNDYQSNPFQMDLQYRGFTASPQLGTAQGISVFLDGIRVNEPFGDVVNWDMLPLNALSGIDVFPGSNPIFGLGTLGGAIAMRTKSGFDGKSLDAEILTGSFGRKQLQISAGNNNGVIAGFLSGNFFLEDGWRDNSPSKVNQIFGKTEWQSERARVGLSMLYAGNKLTGNGLLPEQMVDQNPKQVYTSPDKSKNDLLQFQLSGIWDVTDTFNITGQIYNRKSKRKTKTTDVNENFNGYYTPNTQGRQVLYGYSDINNDGLPDYNTYAVNVAADNFGFALDANGNSAQVLNGNGDFVANPLFNVNNLAVGNNFMTAVLPGQQGTLPANDGSGVNVPRWTADPRLIDNNVIYNFATPAAPGLGEFNNPLPTAFYQFALNYFQNQARYAEVAQAAQGGGAFAGTDEFGNPRPSSYYVELMPGAQGFNIDNGYVDDNGFFNRFIILDPVNSGLRDPNLIVGSCEAGGFLGVCANDANGYQINRDGAYSGAVGQSELGTGTGVIDGTPTAIISETAVDQLGKGGSLQFNWNLDKHKFMFGGSIDKADAAYTSAQFLGMLDGKRNGYEAPNELGYEFYARDSARALRLNDFSGDSITKSIYASETWKPTETLNFTTAARFNWTRVKNSLDVNAISKFLEASLTSLRNEINPLTLCRGVDNDGDGLVDGTFCPTGLDGAIVQYDPSLSLNSDMSVLETTPTEKFNYRSFNPSFGMTWQANEDLNLYGNWSRGARTPTVIELGCAYDDTLVPLPGTNPVLYQERSLADRRTCNLPTTMSGDPHLKQVRSNSMEIGARGRWSENIEWNASLYRTDLTDDIYFVSIASNRSFFQNVGDTKRQGLEMGFKGKLGKASFGVNYALTDATFQSDFDILSPYNSTSFSDKTVSGTRIVDGQVVTINNFGKTRVQKGARMPGVPLHNLNFNFGYEITDKWFVGLNAVMHSEAFVRGNENNQHRAGPATPIRTECLIPDPVNPGNLIGGVCDIPRPDWRDGKTAGYTVFNLQTRYELTKEWALGLQVYNLFNKEYATAGRLGLNAFSPSVNGAIGASGFNYNSSEWQGTSFLGIGAPRSAFITLTYQFKPD